jgi:transposase
VRGHDGLSGLVRNQCVGFGSRTRTWGMDLFAGHLFVFLGRRRDRCKILFWDRGGLVLYYERLEKGRFLAPRVSGDGCAVEMDATELTMLLDGIDVVSVRRDPRQDGEERRTAAGANHRSRLRAGPDLRARGRKRDRQISEGPGAATLEPSGSPKPSEGYTFITA